MKFKYLMSMCVALAALSASAQTHVEGVEYYRADQFNNARELLERNLNNAGTDKAVAHYYLGLLDIRENELASAKKNFDAGIAANPQYAYNYVGLAQLDLANGKTKSAEDNFKLAEKHSKKDAALDVAIARAYYKAPQGATLYAKQIDKYLAKARKINMTEPEIFIFEGDRAYDNNDANNAGTNYEMATSYNPNSADAYVKYANLFRKVNPNFSIEMLKKLLNNNPNSALGQRELAKIYYDLNRYDEAAEQYGKYVNNPNHFKQDEDIYSLMLFYKGDYQKGYDYASKLLNENPNNFTARLYQYRNAAQIKDLESKWVPMAEEIWSIHEKDPKNNGLAQIDYTLIAEELTKAKKLDEARTVLAAAKKDFPKNAGWTRQLAFTYLDEDNYPMTADTYNGYINEVGNASATDLTQAALFNYFAGVLFPDKEDKASKEKYLNQAVDMATKSIAADPDTYRAYKVRGDAKNALDNTANKEAVIADYRTAIQAIDKAGLNERNLTDYNNMKKALGEPEATL